MGKITLITIAEELVARNGVSKELADNFVHAIVETIEKGLREDGLVKVKGLGTFKLMEMSDRGSVDINTGERITIKGYRKVSFTPDSAMKEFVNRPFAHFEPTELNEGYPAEEEQQEVAGDEGAANEIVEEVQEVKDETVAVSEEVSSPVVSEAPVEVKESEAPVEVEESEAPVEVEESEAPVEVVESEAPVAMQESEAVVAEEEPEEIKEESVEFEAEKVDTEEATVDEELIGTVAEEHEESKDVEETVDPESSVSVEMKPKRHSSKRGGCGWLIVVLLVALAYGVYYLVTIDQDSLSYYDARMEEYNDMMVNPNLEEELGEEWGEEPQAVPAPVETLDTVKSEKEQAVTASSGISVVHSEPQKEVAPTPLASAGMEFCAVTLTESLEAKTIKDITLADTTDYVIDGTLITHELKNGETIIQLARKYYGDKRLWPYIVKYNWMKDYNNVAIGQMINIPVLKDKD